MTRKNVTKPIRKVKYTKVFYFRGKNSIICEINRKSAKYTLMPIERSRNLKKKKNASVGLKVEILTPIRRSTIKIENIRTAIEEAEKGGVEIEEGVPEIVAEMIAKEKKSEDIGVRSVC